MFRAVAPSLPASDLDRARAFYKDKLGLEPDETGEGAVRYHVGETMFFLYPSEFAGTNQATAAGFAVDDLDSAVATLRGRGVVFDDVDYGEMRTVDGIMTLPDGSKGAWFKDTEGNILGVVEEPGR